MKLSIVICCFNRLEFTKLALKQLSLLDPKDHEIIIIDNASTDDTQKQLEVLQKQISNLTYIRNETNKFHSAACNQGYKIAKGENVMFLNNDINILDNQSAWTNAIIDQCKDYVVGLKMGQLDNKLNFVKVANEQLDGNSYIEGWCIASSKENWNKLAAFQNGQVFDEKYPFYFNDTNLSFKCRDLNIPLKVVKVNIRHFERASANQFNIPKLYSEARTIFIKDWKRLIK